MTQSGTAVTLGTSNGVLRDSNLVYCIRYLISLNFIKGKFTK